MKKLFLYFLFVGCFTFFTDAGNLSDASGTITSGGTSQVLLAANTSVPRTWFYFQNLSTHVMWLGFGATAVQSQPSIQVAANGGIFRMDNTVSDDAINVVSSTTADAFTCKVR